MADPFLTLNGQPGEFLSRADVNLLSADTAHIFQSASGWINFNNAGNMRVLPDDTSPFGGSSLGFDAILTQAETSVGGATIPFGSDLPIAMSAWIKTEVTTTGHIRIGETTTTQVSPTLPQPAGEWVLHTLTGITKFDTVGVLPRVHVGPLTAGDVCQTAAVMIADGTDPTFVPSLRIVGVVDLRGDLAAAQWDGGGAFQRIIENSDGVFGYSLLLDNLGQFGGYRGDGTDSDLRRTTGQALVNGERHRLRTVRTPGGDVDFYVDDVPTGDTLTDPGGPGEYSGRPVIVASRADTAQTQNLTGDLFSAEVRDGDDGPVVYRMDAADVLAAI